MSIAGCCPGSVTAGIREFRDSHTALVMGAVIQPGLKAWKGVNPGQEAAKMSPWATGCSHSASPCTPSSLSKSLQPKIHNTATFQVRTPEGKTKREAGKLIWGDPGPFLRIGTKRSQPTTGDFLMLQRILLICGNWVRGPKRKKTFVLLKRL